MWFFCSILALALAAHGAGAWVVVHPHAPFTMNLQAAGALRMQEGAGSLTPQAKEGGVTRRDAIIIGGAVAAGSLAPPALAADKKRREPVIATNKNMVEITAGKWLKKHPQPGARDLVVGLGGEPYFLLAGKEGALEPYALRAECTHLGCIAAWRQEMGKHVCPCHGSEYDKTGAVLRGPAPRALELAKVEVLQDGKIKFSEWDDADFRKQ